jgi:uncharacterized paraquat-inducible protein A
MPVRPDGTEYTQWRAGLDAENYCNSYTTYKKVYSQTPQYYVCDNCKIIHYHSLGNCERCPNKLRSVKGRWADLAEELKGYKLGPY